MGVTDTPRTLDPFSDVSIDEFIRLRPTCKVHGRHCLGRSSQRHHALFRRDRRFPQLDVAMNYQPVCENCHMSGEADTRENRLQFYEEQCNKYGQKTVDGWIESLPLREKRL